MVAEWSNASIKHRRLGCGSPEAAEGSLAEPRLTCNCIRRGLSGSCLTGPSAGRLALCLRPVLEEIDGSMLFVIHRMASSSHYYVRRGRPACCTCRHTECRMLPDHVEHGGAGVVLQEETSASSPDDG